MKNNSNLTASKKSDNLTESSQFGTNSNNQTSSNYSNDTIIIVKHGANVNNIFNSNCKVYFFS